MDRAGACAWLAGRRAWEARLAELERRRRARLVAAVHGRTGPGA